MTEKRHIPGFVYKLMLLAATIIWGFAFVVMKDAVDVLPPAQLIGVRFFLTGLLMAAVFHRSLAGTLNGPCLKAGLVLAAVTFLAFWVQTVGLADTTPGKNAFLTGVYCVLVPLCAWLLGHGAPRRMSVIAALVSLVGAGLVVLDNGLPLNVGDALTLAGSVFYALEMVIVAHEGRGRDVWALTFWQFLTITAIVGVGHVLVEAPPAAEAFTPGNVCALAFLALVCSFGCLAVLNYALTKVDPTSGALLSSLESPSGVAFSVAFGYETLTPRLLAGFVLIFAGIVLSEVGTKGDGSLWSRDAP